MCPLDISGYRHLHVMSGSESPDQDKHSGHQPVITKSWETDHA